MATSIHSSHTQKKEVNHTANKNFWQSIEFNRFGTISMLILVIGCLGGVTASFGAHDNIFKLALIVFPTIISLALMLAVAPMRVIIYSSAVAVIIDLLILIF